MLRKIRSSKLGRFRRKVRRANPGPLLLVNPARRVGRKTKRKASRTSRRISRPRNKRGRFVKLTTVRHRRTNPKRIIRKRRVARRVAKRRVARRVPRKANPQRRIFMARKSAKRVRAGKKAWRTRMAKKAARKVRKTHRRRKSNPAVTHVKRRRSRRRNPRGVKGSGHLSALAREVARNQRGGKRKHRRRGTKKHRSYGSTRRSRAAKRAWARRRTGKYFRKGRKIYRKTSRGRRYRRPYKTMSHKTHRKAYREFNPRYSIRTRNPGAMDVVMPVLLGIGGFLGATVLVNMLGPKLPVPETMKKWLPTAIPVALGLAAMFLAPKYLPKFSKAAYGLGFGLLMAGGIGLLKNVVPATMQNKIGLAGYVSRPGAGLNGYTLAPSPSPFLSGYVSRPGAGLGAPLEDRYRRTLGAAVTGNGAGMVPATGYDQVGVKPYGLGLPLDSRRYNGYSWVGVYDKGVYE